MGLIEKAYQYGPVALQRIYFYRRLHPVNTVTYIVKMFMAAIIDKSKQQQINQRGK